MHGRYGHIVKLILFKNMRTEYIVGSNAFFTGMDGFSPKDNDRLILVDNTSECGIPFKTHSELRLKGNCYFFYKRLPKDEMIDNCINSKDPMVIGKFLVPTVIKDLKLTIDDLKRLECVVPLLDDRHKYEEVIFYAYLKNNDFILTDHQRQEAFDIYNKYRISTAV